VAVRVSVVVPVYNPGSHLDRLIASLLRQSLPPDEFEAVFVDDGSTDGTGERLDALASEHPNFRVVHIPNSGWPGRPRNVGIDAARGMYVYFVDNDDWLGDEALKRLYAMAERNASEIVIGKMAGHGRRVPRELFSVSHDRVTLESYAPLTSAEFGIDPLTPHKLFRKAFLDEHAIRFPEGRRRLEDHVFVMRAYFHAEVISILADYVCYHWARRRDNTNAAHTRLDPRGYFENGREVIDIVERHTEPGPLRDRLLAAWYEGKMLWRVGERKVLAYEPEYRRALFAEIHRLAVERFGPGVVERLPAHLRVRSALLQAGDQDRLMALARVESELKPLVQLEDVRSEPRQLVLRLSGRLTYEDGTPFAFTRDGQRLSWDPPVDLGPEVSPADRDVTGEVERSRIDVFVRSRRERAEFFLPGESTIVRHEDDDAVHLSLVAEARLDPLTAAAGRPLPRNVWDVIACVRTAGWGRVTRVGSPSEAGQGTLPPALFSGPVRVALRSTPRGTLSISVGSSRSRTRGRRIRSALLRR
jgi:glycosyltransferase involved in cell wall biosynthesis